MENIPRFNPYTMTDDQILKVHINNNASFKWVLSAIQNNQNISPSTHILISGAHGMGKSFLLRRLQVHFKHYNTIALFLFPEITSNMYHPDDFLINIQTMISKNSCSSFPRWPKGSGDNWQKHGKNIQTLVKQSPYKHIIVCIENLDSMLTNPGIFSNASKRKQLQNFLADSSFLTLITTQTGALSPGTSYFFDNFTKHSLSSWLARDHAPYLKQIFFMHNIPYEQHPKIKLKALKYFTGGNPRNVLIMADILKYNDIFKTIQAFEKSIDLLTPYYQNQLRSLLPLHRLLLDVIFRCTATYCTDDLASLVQADEKDISQHISLLVQQGYVRTEQNNGRSPYIIINDHLFAHYYRMRHVSYQKHQGELAAVSQFLTTFYDHQELKKLAQEFFKQGNTLVARDLMHIILADFDLSIDKLSWSDDISSLFQAFDICESQNFELPKSEKKAAVIHQYMIDLMTASKNGPMDLKKKHFCFRLFGSISLNEKAIGFIFQKCVQNQLSDKQWLALDCYLISERMRITRAYGAFVTRLMDQMATSEIVPDVIQESRINRLKKSDPDMYYALVVFCFSRLPFDVSSEIQLEAHIRCIHNTSDIGFKVFHYEQMAWHQGCLNELHESIICFEKALTIRKKQNQPSRQAWILSQMGWCYQLQKDYDKSFEMHEQACHLYTEDDPINYAWNIGCIGRIHGKCGRFEAAIARHEEAIGILVNNPDIRLSAWNWSRIARNQTRLKRYDLAMNAHQTALKLLEKQMDKELQAWNLEGLAWIYGKVNQYDDAIKVQQQALQYRSQEGNISQQAWNLEGIGWSLGKLERFEEALKVLNRALKVRKNFNHIKGQAWNLEGIARFLGNLGRHDEAIAAHERALVFQEKENNHERQIWNYRGIAWNYKEKNDHDNAIMALNQALNHAKQSESIYWQATLWALIGWNLRQMHRLSDAIKAHEQAIKLYQRQNNTAGILENAGQMAINCFILGQTGRAWNILDHYGASMKCPQKLLSSMGDTIVYLKKNVRQSMAFKTAVNIIDGYWLRRKQWDIQFFLQGFLSLIITDQDIHFNQKLASYIQERYTEVINSQIQAIFDLIDYWQCNCSTDFFADISPDRKLAVEALIDALRI